MRYVTVEHRAVLKKVTIEQNKTVRKCKIRTVMYSRVLIYYLDHVLLHVLFIGRSLSAFLKRYTPLPYCAKNGIQFQNLSTHVWEQGGGSSTYAAAASALIHTVLAYFGHYEI